LVAAARLRRLVAEDQKRIAERNAGAGLPSGQTAKSPQTFRDDSTGCQRCFDLSHAHQPSGVVACGMWYMQSPQTTAGAGTARITAGISIVPCCSLLAVAAMTASISISSCAADAARPAC
jgi:hypothetical protein